MSKHIYDVAGIGFGPANIALAVCLEEMNSPLDVCFFDTQNNPSWQHQMLLDGSDIQNNPLRDFVTPRNPRSHYSFVNYLKLKGRLFEYLNLPSHYPLRREFASYIQWVSEHFTDLVRVGVRVEGLEWTEQSGEQVWRLRGSDGSEAFARSVVLGTGRSANIPAVFRPVLGDRVFHLSHYLERLAALPPGIHRIGVVGASQSAVEILLDLMGRFPKHEIHSIQRSFGFRQKDLSPFSDRVYFPEFVDYFYGLPSEGKRNINRQLRGTNYSSADADVIQALYMKLYEEKLNGKERFFFDNNTEVTSVNTTNESVHLGLKEVNTGNLSSVDLDAVVLATGFLDLSGGPVGEKYPPLLAPFANEMQMDHSSGVLHVTRDYKVNFNSQRAPALFLNGLCEGSHGLGDAGSFSLLSIRSEVIANALVAVLVQRDVKHQTSLPSKIAHGKESFVVPTYQEFVCSPLL